MTARELEAQLIEHYGPDFRDKAIVTPFGAFPLRDAFAECGLTDPQALPSNTGYGLWQMAPSQWPPG